MSNPESLNVIDPEFRIGRIRAVKYDRGYGFVRAKATGDTEATDYFFHMTSFADEENFWDAKPAMKLRFNLIEAANGRTQAGNCSLVKEK